MNKKALRLMFEYLKRSDEYKEYCEWQRQRQRNPNNKKSLPRKFRAPKNSIFHHIPVTYLEYGDVHTLSFTEFYEKMKSSKPIGASPGIVEFVDISEEKTVNIFKEKTNDVIDYFKKVKAREPNIHELIKYWQNLFENHLGIIYLRVDHARNSTEELMELFRKIVRKKKKDPSQIEFRQFSKQFGGITSNYIRLYELNMYLKVFDLWEKTDKQGKKLHTMKDIIKKVGTKADKAKLKKADAESVVRKYRLYRSKAEKIIKNVEYGYFPGKYN